jgi:hypothetical protein
MKGHKMVSISRDTKNAIYATWDSIACDAYDICEDDNTIAMELVLDASRLTMNGFAEADAEIKTLCVEHGWGKVCEELAKRIQLL